MKRTFRIPDMHCPNCAMRLESMEDALTGILKIKASYHQQTLVVEFDEKNLPEQTLIDTIKKLGYTPEAVE